MGKGIREYSDPGAEGRLEELIRMLASRAGPAGPAGPSGTVPIVANIAALSALSIVGLSTGSLAVVQTLSALWYLDTASTATTDGITVVATSGAGRWFRGPSMETEVAQAQTAWFIDPVAGNDENTGLTSPTALKTKAERYRRLGGREYLVPGINVIVTYVNADTTNTDPLLDAPLIRSGGSVTHTSALPATSFTGTLLAVTAKSRSGNQALNSTFTTSTGAIAVGMLLVNTSRSNSRAFAVRNLGSNVWLITQPLAAYTLGTGGTFPTATENDNWTNGDTINGYALQNIDAPVLGGQILDYVSGSLNGGHFLYQLNVFEPNAPEVGDDPINVDARSGAFFIESNIGRSYNVVGNAQFVPLWLNCFFSGQGVGKIGGFVTFAGGAIANTTGASFYAPCKLQSDVIVSGNSILGMHDGGFLINVYVDGTTTITTTGTCSSATGINYGSGKINSQGIHQFTGLAVTTFPLSGGLQLNGVATGYSVTTGVVSSPISLTAAHLDAASGAAGFGGTASNLAGAAFTNGTQN
jgi:hypothetical protein